MKEYKTIEESFQKIRACSGNSDVREMVTKFMTRDITYVHLLKQVNEKEKKYERLRNLNEEKTAKLK